MTKKDVSNMIKNHNNMIDYYIKNDLPKELYKAGVQVYKGTIPASGYFIALSFIQNQGFYDKGKKILDKCRAEGYEVKINMQDYHLIGYGLQ